MPLSAAVWLFGSGLLGLVGMARRKIADEPGISERTLYRKLEKYDLVGVDKKA